MVEAQQPKTRLLNNENRKEFETWCIPSLLQKYNIHLNSALKLMDATEIVF